MAPEQLQNGSGTAPEAQKWLQNSSRMAPGQLQSSSGMAPKLHQNSSETAPKWLQNSSKTAPERLWNGTKTAPEQLRKRPNSGGELGRSPARHGENLGFQPSWVVVLGFGVARLVRHFWFVEFSICDIWKSSVNFDSIKFLILEIWGFFALLGPDFGCW